MSDEALICLSGLVFAYPGRPPVINGLDLALYPGQRLGLTGPNGCGKTTALSVIMGLLKPQAGTVAILGKVRKSERDFREIRTKLGFVFQDANDQLFCPTVAEDIAFGPLNMGKSPKEAARIALEVLDSLGLSGFASRVTYDLSGGEKKLVALGTALALDPKLLILDEPTNFLDKEAVSRLSQMVLKSGLPAIIVSHDQSFLDITANCQAQMLEGRLAKTEI
jgi:cobalt/nickel transport system ATP-binding protein